MILNRLQAGGTVRAGAGGMEDERGVCHGKVRGHKRGA